jgi:hypothetical protein
LLFACGIDLSSPIISIGMIDRKELEAVAKAFNPQADVNQGMSASINQSTPHPTIALVMHAINMSN